MSTYSEHMAWCKQRALDELEHGDCGNALASMASDVRKHPETYTEAVTMLIATVGMQHAVSGDRAQMRRFIEGFAS